MARELDIDSVDFATIVRPGDTVAWGQASAEPVPLVRRLMEQRQTIGHFNVFLGATYSDILTPEHADCVRFTSYCGTGRNRALANAGALDIVPCHYSQLPSLIARRTLPVDVLVLQLSASADDRGFSFGLGHDYLAPMLESARLVVAEVNDQAPWTYGSSSLGDDDIDFIVRTSRAPVEVSYPPPGAVELAIGRNVAALIDDRATLQFGLGAVPDAILSQLSHHRDLGVHTGGIGDRAADLMDAGVITNARKSIDPNIAVAGIMFGTRRLFAFAHRNPRLELRSVAYTHDPDVLSAIDRFVAINSALEVDLTGQINAEVAGRTYLGAVGGAVDFLRGAHRSIGGLPIVALPSTHGAASRIVEALSGPVSTGRSDAGIVVTEHGVADLRGASISQRVSRMLAIADPAYREQLARNSASRR
jgi:acyl-CoA hydrolase